MTEILKVKAKKDFSIEKFLEPILGHKVKLLNLNEWTRFLDASLQLFDSAEKLGIDEYLCEMVSLYIEEKTKAKEENVTFNYIR